MFFNFKFQPLNIDEQTEEAIILIRSLSVILRGQPDWVNRIIIQLISKLTKHWMKKVESPTNIKIKDFRFISAVARLIENCSKSHEGEKNNGQPSGYRIGLRSPKSDF